MPKNKVYFVLLKYYIIIIYACIKHHIAKLLIVGPLAGCPYEIYPENMGYRLEGLDL